MPLTAICLIRWLLETELAFLIEGAEPEKYVSISALYISN